MTDPWKLETTYMTLAYKDEDFLVDHNSISPWGILKDVPVKVNYLLIPVDFVII
ncbi:hypothetical protein A2U01_0093310, partial [Trifolium medium]|nr:hypothetical protein [Trifolium medium]